MRARPAASSTGLASSSPRTWRRACGSFCSGVEAAPAAGAPRSRGRRPRVWHVPHHPPRHGKGFRRIRHGLLSNVAAATAAAVQSRAGPRASSGYPPRVRRTAPSSTPRRPRFYTPSGGLAPSSSKAAAACRGVFFVEGRRGARRPLVRPARGGPRLSQRHPCRLGGWRASRSGRRRAARRCVRAAPRGAAAATGAAPPRRAAPRRAEQLLGGRPRRRGAGRVVQSAATAPGHHRRCPRPSSSPGAASPTRAPRRARRRW